MGDIMKNAGIKITALFCVAFCAASIIFNDRCTQGVKNAMYICKDILIPSMFPFLIMSKFASHSRVSEVFAWIFGKACKAIFHLPENCAAVIIMSMTCGYPTGASMVGTMLDNDIIDVKTAKRLMKFSYNPGIPFCVVAVGKIMLSNEKIGWMIYACACLACISVAVIDGFFHRKDELVENQAPTYLPMSQAIINGVNDAAQAMLAICTYVVIFSCIFSLLGNFDGKQYIMPLFEITAGTALCAGKIPLELMTVYIVFGGLCIHMQVFDTVIKSGHTFLSFLQYRAVCALLSGLFFTILIKLFPQSQDVFSNITQTSHSFASISTAASVSMIIMCVVMIFDIDAKRKKI